MINIIIRIPDSVAPYEGDIRRFVDAMIYKLASNTSKGRWESYSLAKAMELLDGERNELAEAIEGGNMIEIILEAADVANFAMIAAAIAIERGK